MLLWWFTPESPRWLINQHKWRPLDKILVQIKRWNNVTFPPDLEIPREELRKTKVMAQSDQHEKSKNIIQWYEMFTNSALRRRSFIMMFNWGMVALVYYGIGMSMTQLGGDIFINFILAAVGEILGYLYNITVADFWGRKPTMIVGYDSYF